MERSARFVAVLLLRHLATAEFSENRDRLFGSVEPINAYAVVGVGVFGDLEHIGWFAVVKFHSQRIRRKDVVGDVTAPLSGDVFIRRRVGDLCCQYPTRKKRNKSLEPSALVQLPGLFHIVRPAARGGCKTSFALASANYTRKFNVKF